MVPHSSGAAELTPITIPETEVAGGTWVIINSGSGDKVFVTVQQWIPDDRHYSGGSLTGRYAGRLSPIP